MQVIVVNPYLAGAGVSFDFYIDTTLGNDSNDGSEESPWKTLSKISGIALSAGVTRTVLVKSGTYDSSDDFVRRDDASTGGSIGPSATLSITFESGCTMDGTAANAISLINGFEFSGANAWTSIIQGNGLVVQNYSEATVDSPNGVGNRGNNTVRAYDVNCINCDDGFSCHATAKMYLYRCTASGSEKSPFIHVDTAYVEAHDCEFTLSTVNNVVGAGTPTIKLFNTKLLANAPTGVVANLSGVEVVGGQIGSLSNRIQILGTATITDAFINLYADGNVATGAMTRCYGKLSLRVRGTSGQVVQNCVITGPATGQTAVFFSNFNGGTNCQFIVRNNIFETTTAAAFMSIDATNAAYLVNGASDFHNNVLNGAAAYDADLISADDGTVILGTITGDALIGAANTTTQSDYAFVEGTGSAAENAATDGGNCGFSSLDIEP